MHGLPIWKNILKYSIYSIAQGQLFRHDSTHKYEVVRMIFFFFLNLILSKICLSRTESVPGNGALVRGDGAGRTGNNQRGEHRTNQIQEHTVYARYFLAFNAWVNPYLTSICRHIRLERELKPTMPPQLFSYILLVFMLYFYAGHTNCILSGIFRYSSCQSKLLFPSLHQEKTMKNLWMFEGLFDFSKAFVYI